MPCMSVDASVMGSGSVWCSGTLRVVGGFMHNCGLVRIGFGIRDVDLGGTSWVLFKIFSVRSSFSVRLSFPCGYTGSKVGDGIRGVSVAGSASECNKSTQMVPLLMRHFSLSLFLFYLLFLTGHSF